MRPSVDAEVAEPTDIATLEAFVVNNVELYELERMVAGFNLFEAIGAVRREERHSDFLAFLLDPSASHGLGSAFLRRFALVCLDAPLERPGELRKVDVALMDLSDARSERESAHVDVLVSSARSCFVLLVENKVDSAEHSDQLARYLASVSERFPTSTVLPVCLTVDGRLPSHPEYYAVGYAQIYEILRDILDREAGTLAADVSVAIRHYVQILERHFVSDTPIAKLAERIYARHSRAIDLILEHRPDTADLIRRAAVKAIAECPDLRLVYNSKSYIHFVPLAWDAIDELARGGDGTWFKPSEPELVRFEIKQQGQLTIHLIIGPGTPKVREHVHRGCHVREGDKLFAAKASLTARFAQVWVKPLIAKKEYETESVEKLIATFRSTWDSFVTADLQALTAAVSAIATSVPSPGLDDRSP